MVVELEFGVGEEAAYESVAAVFSEAGAACFADQGLDGGLCAVSVAFKSADEMQELNRVFRGIDAPTDVLTFPAFDSFAPALAAVRADVSEPLLAGDIAICPEIAKRQAQEYGHSFKRELVYLFVHGMFHILGFDHEADEERKDMRECEERVMGKLGLVR